MENSIWIINYLVHEEIDTVSMDYTVEAKVIIFKIVHSGKD